MKYFIVVFKVIVSINCMPIQKRHFNWPWVQLKCMFTTLQMGFLCLKVGFWINVFWIFFYSVHTCIFDLNIFILGKVIVLHNLILFKLCTSKILISQRSAIVLQKFKISCKFPLLIHFATLCTMLKYCRRPFFCN